MDVHGGDGAVCAGVTLDRYELIDFARKVVGRRGSSLQAGRRLNNATSHPNWTMLPASPPLAWDDFYARG
jgi:hypothetical protein